MKALLIVFAAIIIVAVLCYVGLRQLFNIGTIDLDLDLTPGDIYRKDEKPVDRVMNFIKQVETVEQGRTLEHVKNNENTLVNCMIIIVIVAIAASCYLVIM